MNYSQLLDDVQEEVTGFFQAHQHPHFSYHNIAHTEAVVAHAGEIARHYQLGDREYFIVITAAWFHDTGYYLGEAAGHESRGAALAADFLSRKEVDDETIAKVRECIMATCMPQSPNDLLEQIVADADLYHWGTPEFAGFNKRMRKEAGWRHDKKIDKTTWRAGTIRLLETHQYQTDYARELLEPVKQENIAKLKAKEQEEREQDRHREAKETPEEKDHARHNNHKGHRDDHPRNAHRDDHARKGHSDDHGRKAHSDDHGRKGHSDDHARKEHNDLKHPKPEKGYKITDPDPTDESLARSSFPVLAQAGTGDGTGEDEKNDDNRKDRKAKDKKVKSDRPERGIETMFRISSNNHQRLSDMADNKANIMITTTSIILSVLLSVLLRKLEDNPHLIIPTLILLLVCVITMVFSILATRPSLPHGTFTEQNIEEKKVNLLFFGNFYRMAYSEYEHGMQEMMNDRDFLYGSLTRDVYSQGVVLGRKYRLLRIAYNVFMFGVIVSVLAFIIAVTLNGI